MPANVAQLAQIRSQLAEALEAYYEGLIRNVAATPWNRPLPDQPETTRAVLIKAVGIPIRVLKKVIKPGQPANVEEKSGRRKRVRDSAGLNNADPQTAELYEEPLDRDTVEVSWERERRRDDVRRIVIFGGPGSGKTVLTQLTALELAEEGLAKLRGRRTKSEELPIPVLIHLDTLADAATAAPASSEPWPANCFRKLMTHQYGVSDYLTNWLTETTHSSRQEADLARIGTSRCWLILDALDQVADTKLEGLWALLKALESQGWRSKIIITCRTAEYRELPWNEITRYSLAPLGSYDIRELIGKWFGPEDGRGQAVHGAITRSYSLRHACRTPLIVTFACLVGEKQPWTITSRRGLYVGVLDGLLEMRWREAPTAASSIPQSDLTEILHETAWFLFKTEPESNIFSDRRLVNAIESTERFEKLPLAQKTPTAIRDELVRRGIIFKAKQQATENAPHYSFVHRTLLEFLTAEYLATVLRTQGWDNALVSWEGGKVRVDLLVTKMTWMPAWQETLVMMTAALGEEEDQERAIRLVTRMTELIVEGR